MNDTSEEATSHSSIGVSIDQWAAVAILVWVVVELILRQGVVRILAGVVGSARGADVILLGIGFPLLAYGLARWGMQRGISASDWDYDISVQSIGLGFAIAIVYFVVVAAITSGYTQIVETPQSASLSTALSENIGEALWIAIGFFLGNGIIVPISEELAWRGVIQTSFMQSYGTYVGGTLTAVAFVVKHLIVDAGAPFLRVVSLILLSFFFCGLRARYGTASSTVAHIAVNGIVSASVVFVAL